MNARVFVCVRAWLQVGTLDTLIKESDTLASNDTYCEM